MARAAATRRWVTRAAAAGRQPCGWNQRRTARKAKFCGLAPAGTARCRLEQARGKLLWIALHRTTSRRWGFSLDAESGAGGEEGESESGSAQDTTASLNENTPDEEDENAADEEVPALLVYPLSAKRPTGSDLAFSFSWASRLLDSLKRLFGEERAFSCLFGHVPLCFSTHFSGLGTAELAVQMLAAAGRRSFRAELRLQASFSCEISGACRAVLKERSPGRCVHANLLARFGHAPEAIVGRHVRAGRLNFRTCCDAMLRSPLSPASPCAEHGGACLFGRADIDVAGSPCPPWSRAGLRKGREDPRTALTIAWLAWLRHARPRAAVHENVVGFDEKLLEELAGDMYFVRSIRMAPSDMGFPFIRRPRSYSLLIRRQGRRGTPPASLQALYDAIVRDMAHEAEEGSLAWAFCAPKEELLEVENAARSRRGHAPLLDGPTSDWTYLLTDAQRARLKAHEARTAGAAGMRVFDLGQNPHMSSPSTSIPTIRCNTHVVWSRELRRWMTKYERLECMGFPVFDALASAAHVATDRITAKGRSRSIGNAMHVANVGCAIAMSCLCL